MGWTVTDLGRNRTNLVDAKARHVYQATQYCNGVKAEMLGHEWKQNTFFAIIRLVFPAERNKAPETFLRVDMIEQSAGSFGYKDMSEEMGPYVDDKPSREFAALVYKYIPVAKGYAKEFRDRMGIKYDAAEQMQFAIN